MMQLMSQFSPQKRMYKPNQQLHLKERSSKNIIKITFFTMIWKLVLRGNAALNGRVGTYFSYKNRRKVNNDDMLNCIQSNVGKIKWSTNTMIRKKKNLSRSSVKDRKTDLFADSSLQCEYFYIDGVRKSIHPDSSGLHLVMIEIIWKKKRWRNENHKLVNNLWYFQYICMHTTNKTSMFMCTHFRKGKNHMVIWWKTMHSILKPSVPNSPLTINGVICFVS